jgi:succinate-semialdehyde dehydrogenase/glutarate-semialdehyde dehydrogenase
MPTPQKILTFTNPATGQVFGHLEMSTPEEVQLAITEMRTSFPEWSRKPVWERIRILRKFQELMIDCVDEITEVINQDCGKSRQDALFEVFMTVDMLDAYLQRGKRWLRRYQVPRRLFFSRNATWSRVHMVWWE